MDRKHLPKLEGDQIFEHKAGWFLINEKDGHIPAFHCKCGENGELRNHSIESNGEINASVLCPKNDYHEFCILDDWDKCYRKKAGDRYYDWA